MVKISADKKAKELVDGQAGDREPVEKAFKIASHYAKELSAIETGDLNTAYFDMRHIKKQARYWTQVANVLNKQR